LPIFIATYYFRDDRNGVTEKQFRGDFTDYATADTAASDLATDLTAVTGAAIYRYTLAQVFDLANTPTAGARVTDRMSATVYLDVSANKKANFTVPAPASAILSGNSLLQSTAWHDLTDNFTATGGWEISDGEHVDKPGGATDGTVTGKLISVRSGVRTLPQ
jgi:hypothetical protein